MRPQTVGSPRPVTLGEAVNGVRWDFDPAQPLLSPLVAAARFFESYPWDGDAGNEPGSAHGPAVSPAPALG